jgi:hypothetical protein
VFSLVQLSRGNGTAEQIVDNKMPSVRLLGSLKYEHRRHAQLGAELSAGL